MKKLSEYKDEDALDLLAEIMEPAVIIMGDEEIKKVITSGNRIKIAKIIIKNHKQQVLEILAAMEGVSVKDYHCNILTLPMRLLEILNDKELIQVFTSQAQEISQ